VLLLAPWCLVIFLAGAALEAVYCLLYRVTPLRVLLSGVIKTLGGAAAIVAVDSHPPAIRVAVFLAMIFFWEIGGQNIPADWTDIDEDRRMKARTIPVHIGGETATLLILVCLAAATAMSLVLLAIFDGRLVLPFMAAALAAGAALLLYPSLELLQKKERSNAQAVFNAASYYPLALLLIVAVRTLVLPTPAGF
jgi:4-hydroxybenzoate polyprenyltransferase